jgi:hypothetical protein
VWKIDDEMATLIGFNSGQKTAVRVYILSSDAVRVLKPCKPHQLVLPISFNRKNHSHDIQKNLWPLRNNARKTTDKRGPTGRWSTESNKKNRKRWLRSICERKYTPRSICRQSSTPKNDICAVDDTVRRIDTLRPVWINFIPFLCADVFSFESCIHFAFFLFYSWVSWISRKEKNEQSFASELTQE